MNAAESQGAPGFLRALDAVVADDAAHAGFAAVLSFVVRTDARDHCLNIRVVPAGARGAFDDTVALDADVVLLLGETEATALLEDGALPAQLGLAQVSGDCAKLGSFVRRYLGPDQDLISIRASGAPPRAPRRRR